jgi:hypothetical protein
VNVTSRKLERNHGRFPISVVRPPWPRRWRGLSLMMKLVVLSGDVGSLWCCEPVGQTGVGASRVS